MVDKEYCIRKALEIVYKINAKDANGNISETKIAEIASRKLANELITEETKGNKNTIRAFADRFVNDPYNKKLWMSEGFTEEQYKDVLRKYLNIVFEVKDPTGVDLNNNEIFDMSYAVLTSESNVARALKPGGFDEHKHMAYAVAAFRIPEVRKKYPNFDTLLKMDTKEIGKLIERNDKNLIFLDTQLEYYDHNNSASSLLGISAVNSVAHAILVDDNIGIDLTGIAIPTIAGFKFGQVTSPSISSTIVNKGEAHQTEFEVVSDNNTGKENTQFNKLGTLDNPENFNTPQESEQLISSEKTILSNEELQYWNEQGIGKMPRILVGSERTDPAFHVNEILDILDGKTTVPEWGVVNGKRAIVNQVSGKDFAGLYLITKHDGLPMLKLLQTKIPKLIHFSITGLGGTKYEPGVMKYNDLLDRIEDYIKQGLDPNSVTIRIDPIVPGVTTKEDIENIVKRASIMGIKRIRFSVMDAYPSTKAAMSKLGYDFNMHYGNNFFANKEYIDDICNFMLSLKDKYNITLGTCAEAIARKGISKEGCLSVGAVNSMLGTSIEDKGTDNNNQRKLCTCYGGKIDALQYNNKCASHCVYCYAKHENNTAMRYYNEDGSLKDNNFTRTRTSVMRLDPSIAADGASIAETLGSNVAASADAAKDPVLNFMNLNPQTFNVYTTLIRSGMPNSVATLLMSSKVLANAVTESNAKTLAGELSTPESVLREKLSSESLEKLGYLPSSSIFIEELTRDELIRGLHEDNVNIDLKITNALVALFDVSKKVRLADQITRFNSTSSAVGPTTLDNYIFQKKLDTLDKESSLIDMSTGNPIGAKGLLDKHQMLYEFSRAYDLANSILIDGMPQTRAFIESMESIYAVPNKVAGLELKFGLPSIVINDRALVGKLRDFFTSWSAMKAGLVSYSELEFLSKEFPKTITKKKNEHSDNYLVQNLYLNIDNRSGFPIIAMNISKIEKASRDMLTASWADLYTKDKEFALNLFKYSLFRGGIGFSPKTFMNVLPIQMKLDIEGYLKLFKEPETLTTQEANLLYKQFVSNNAMNNKLVPIKKIKPREVREDGRIIISKKDSRAESFRNVRFFKIKDGESYKLYECVGGFEDGPAYRIYKEIPMLGAEGNFIEISTKNIDKSLFDVKFDQEDDGSMKLTPDVNDIPADRQRTIVEARKILDDILTQNQQEQTKQRMSSLEEEAKQVFIQRASARLSTILQEKGYTPIKEETFNEMLKQLDLC